jgi:hypothetical protein
MVLVPTMLAPWSAGAGLERVQLLPAATPGWLGRTLALPAVALVGSLGALLMFLLLLTLLLIATVGWHPLRTRRAVKPAEPQAPALVEPVWAAVVGAPGRTVPVPAAEAAPVVPSPEPSPVAQVQPEKPKRVRPKLEPPAAPESAGTGVSEIPPISLLSEPPWQDTTLSEAELDRLGRVLIETLRSR